MNPLIAPKLQPAQIRNIIRQFLLENLLLGQEAHCVDACESFVEARAIDSTGFLELVFFLQARFGIQVDDDEMAPQHFDNLNRIVAYVLAKLGS
ncbi:MAG TPA: acyl carrier protein [Steroidobacter sp.]|nr:acyl carrier protein [Steroidobacter sp.]